MLISAHGLTVASVVPDKEPHAFINQVLEKLESLNVSGKLVTRDERYTFIRKDILSHFAIKEMARWICGPYLQNMSSENQHAIENRLSGELANIIYSNLGSLKSIRSRVAIDNVEFRNHSNAIVGMQVRLHNNALIKLELHMRSLGNSWKVIDIRAYGTSALIYFRNRFLPQLQGYSRKTETSRNLITKAALK